MGSVLTAPVDMKMPWGKYKGKDVSELPVPYLKWLHRTLPDIDAPIYGAVIDALNKAKKRG